MHDASNPRNELPGPYRINLRNRKRYLWCACGRSAKQPLCDASHEGSRFQPVSYEAAEDITVAFCGCKLTKNPPFCDGSHVHVARNVDGLPVRSGDC
jgi:CDGSH iron-sulfur domain-containing protein 3